MTGHQNNATANGKTYGERIAGELVGCAATKPTAKPRSNGAPEPLRMQSLRVKMLNLARDALAHVHAPNGTVVVRVSCAGMELLLDSLPGESPDELSQPLTDMEAAILSVCSAEPQTSKRIAKLAGYAYSSRLRSAVTGLCRRGLLIQSPDGYRRP
jgi:hypothetical protein